MFDTMILPHLDYSCTIWGTTSDTNIGKLQKNQNRGMRIILKCHPRTHIADMLSNLKWLSIKKRIMFLPAVLVFKIMHSKTPNYMSHWLVHVSHQYGARGSTSADLFVTRSHPNSLTTKDTWLWNKLPTSIRTFPNLKTFKKPQLSSWHIILTSTNIPHIYTIYHIHKHLHNKSSWLHTIPPYDLILWWQINSHANTETFHQHQACRIVFI